MECKMKKVRLAVLYLMILIGGATGVKNLEMKVPAMVRSGDSAVLSCRYELEETPLYAIQWYLDEHEFYRFEPTKSPPQTTYPDRRIKIDIKNSNINDVILRNVSREFTGMYKCEVFEDAPSYHTVSQQQRMEVADVPETDPVIAVEKQRLPAGETLRANCTSGTSHPAPNVTWTLNGGPLNDTTMQYKTWTRKNPKLNMEFTWSGLELKITNRMFQNGRLRLRCFATIYGVYTATTEYDVNEDRPLIASITRDAAPHSHSSSVLRHGGLITIFGPEGLARMAIIVGGLIASTPNFR